MDVFLIEDDKLLKNIMIFEITSATVYKKEFNSKSIYNERFLKIKIKSYDGEATTDYNRRLIKCV